MVYTDTAVDAAPATTTPAQAASRGARLLTALSGARRNRLLPLLFLWLALGAYFAATENHFLDWQNITSTLEQNSVLFTVAMAETVVLLAGAVDLSAGALLALTGLVLTISNSGVPPWAALVLTVLTGGVLSGCLNGLPIGLAKMNPFVVTLGTASIFLGVANVITNANTEVINNATLLSDIVGKTIGSFPIVAIEMLAVFAAFWWMLRYTYFGRNVYAVGGNAEAATLAGISVARVRIAAFVILGLATGFAAALYAGQLLSVAPSSGTGLELRAITVVLLGGTSLAGGRGGVGGTALAVLFLATLQNGLDIGGVSSFWQDIVTGSVLVLAVGFDQARQHLAENRNLKGER